MGMLYCYWMPCHHLINKLMNEFCSLPEYPEGDGSPYQKLSLAVVVAEVVEE